MTRQYYKAWANSEMLKRHPKTVCLVPSQERKDWLIKEFGVNPDQIIVAGQPTKGRAAD